MKCETEGCSKEANITFFSTVVIAGKEKDVEKHLCAECAAPLFEHRRPSNYSMGTKKK